MQYDFSAIEAKWHKYWEENHHSSVNRRMHSSPPILHFAFCIFCIKRRWKNLPLELSVKIVYN